MTQKKDLQTIDLDSLDAVSGGFGGGPGGAGGLGGGAGGGFGGGAGGGGDWMSGVANSYSQARASGQQTTRTPMVNSPSAGPPSRTPMVGGGGSGGWMSQAGGAIDSFLGQ